jgi:hypothetical protein
VINPATNEKLDEVITAIGAWGGGWGGGGNVWVLDSSGTRINPSTKDTDTDVAYTLAMLLDALQFGLQTDKSKTLKVQLDPLLTHTALVSTITTLTTLTNLANIQRQWDMQMQRITEAQMDAAYIPWVYNNLIFP